MRRVPINPPRGHDPEQHKIVGPIHSWGDPREQAEQNEAPQVVAHRAYTETLGRSYHDGPDRDTLKCEEDALKAALMALQRHYQLQAEPWIKRLSTLDAMKPIKIVSSDERLEPAPDS
jgi:hypothetical protein